jgi:hypothetical protein
MKNEESDGEPITTDSFFVVCKQTGLDLDDLDHMTIGGCLDFIDEYIEYKKPNKKKKARKAKQSDFDAF